MSESNIVPNNLGDPVDSDQRTDLGTPIEGETDPEGIAGYDATTGDDFDDPDAIDITQSDGPNLEEGDDLS